MRNSALDGAVGLEARLLNRRAGLSMIRFLVEQIGIRASTIMITTIVIILGVRDALSYLLCEPSPGMLSQLCRREARLTMVGPPSLASRCCVKLIHDIGQI